jgi:hypothetical protein
MLCLTISLIKDSWADALRFRVHCIFVGHCFRFGGQSRFSSLLSRSSDTFGSTFVKDMSNFIYFRFGNSYYALYANWGASYRSYRHSFRSGRKRILVSHHCVLFHVLLRFADEDCWLDRKCESISKLFLTIELLLLVALVIGFSSTGRSKWTRSWHSPLAFPHFFSVTQRCDRLSYLIFFDGYKMRST